MAIIPFDRSSFRWGQPGIPGSGITSLEVGTINSRLSALESVGSISELNDLSDVTLSSPTSGQILRHDGTDWKNYTPGSTTVTFNVPFVLDGGGAAITAGTKYQGIEIPFAATITGWTITGNASGSIVCTVSKATYANHPTYTAISGTEKPTLSSASKNQDLSLSTWTTAVSAGDLLQVSVDALATTVVLVTVNIRMTRTI